jgi:hypothetical protein
VPNTLNAALCLGELGRYDEALELYESVLTDFRETVTAEQKQTVAAESARLRDLVGSVTVVANVDGQLVIDGRPRGRLPLHGPVRLLPGEHVVRVLKEGYESFDKTVVVEIGKTAPIQAELRVLADAGRLAIEGSDLAGAEVWLDGAPVGAAPWGGTVAPGEHQLVLLKGDRGTAPTRVMVVAGQTALITPVLQPLGPEVRIAVEPPSAALSIGGVVVGKGRFMGRLPLGVHRLEVSEEGYHTSDRELEMTKDGPTELTLHLAIDDAHPRWASGAPSLLFVEAFGGPGLAPGFGSEAEAGCDADYTCSSSGIGLGFLAGVRAGYEFPFGVSLQLAGGYVLLGKQLDRQVAEAHAGAPIQFDLSDELRVAGVLAGAGVGYRYVLAEPFELRGNLFIGALFAGARDSVSATLSGGGQTVDARVEGSGESVSGPDLFVLPEVQATLRFGGFTVGAGLGVAIFTLQGPDGALGGASATDLRPCQTDPNHVSCAQQKDFAQAEKPYGPFVTFVPGVSAGYAFSL